MDSLEMTQRREKGESENGKLFIIIVHAHKHWMLARVPMQSGTYPIIMLIHTLKDICLKHIPSMNL